MTRRTLFSDRPRSSEVPSEADPISGVEQAGGDFGRWLTHDLRPKGAPSQAPPTERSIEVQSFPPQSLLVPVQEEPELASWLLRDLKPRSSSPPHAYAHGDALSQAETLPAQAAVSEAAVVSKAAVGFDAAAGSDAALSAPAASAPLSLASPSAERAANSLLPPDSLVPHAVSEAPRALAARSEAALDDDDLAVLPSSRARRAGQRRWRHVAVLAALLGALALVFWRRSSADADAMGGGVDPALSAALAAAPLPPPPPQLKDEDSDSDDPPAPVPAVSHRASPAPDEAELPELSGPHGRRAGDAVARFADLPTPTLSKLAREERQKARSRDARVRAQKAASNSGP